MAESPPACPLPGPGQERGRTSQTLSSALRALGAFKTSASLSLRVSFQKSPPFPTSASLRGPQMHLGTWFDSSAASCRLQGGFREPTQGLGG